MHQEKKKTYSFFISYYIENGTFNNCVITSDLPRLSWKDIQIIKNKLEAKNGKEVRIAFFTRVREEN